MRCSAQALDDDLAADSLFDVLPGFLQDFAGQHHHRRGTVANFGILRNGDVGENLGGRVNDFEELQGQSNGATKVGKPAFMTVAPSLVMV